MFRGLCCPLGSARGCPVEIPSVEDEGSQDAWEQWVEVGPERLGRILNGSADLNVVQHRLAKHPWSLTPFPVLSFVDKSQ